MRLGCKEGAGKVVKGGDKVGKEVDNGGVALISMQTTHDRPTPPALHCPLRELAWRQGWTQIAARRAKCERKSSSLRVLTAMLPGRNLQAAVPCCSMPAREGPSAPPCIRAACL